MSWTLTFQIALLMLWAAVLIESIRKTWQK